MTGVARHRGRRRRAGPAGDEGLPALRRQRPGRTTATSPSTAGWHGGPSIAVAGTASLFLGLYGTLDEPADRHRPRRRRFPARPVDADPAGGGAGVPRARAPARPPVRPARAARPGERHAQPPPHRRHRRRPDDRDHPGRRGVDPRRVHEGLGLGGGERDPAGRLRGGRQGLGSGGGSGTFSPVVADRLRKTREVAMVSQFRTGQWGLNGATKTLIAVDPKTVTEMHDLDPSTSVGRRSPRRRERARPGQHRRAPGLAGRRRGAHDLRPHRHPAHAPGRHLRQHGGAQRLRRLPRRLQGQLRPAARRPGRGQAEGRGHHGRRPGGRSRRR